MALVADMTDADGVEWSVWGQERISLLTSLAGQLITVGYVLGKNGKPSIRSIGGAPGVQQFQPQVPQPQPTFQPQPQPTQFHTPQAPGATHSAIEDRREASIHRTAALKYAVELFPNFPQEEQTFDTLFRTAEMMRRWLDKEDPTSAPAAQAGPAVHNPGDDLSDIPF